MVEAGRAYGGRRPTAALPGVEPDVMVVAAGRDKRRPVAESLHQLETQHVAVELQSPVEIRDLEVYVPDRDARIDGA